MKKENEFIKKYTFDTVTPLSIHQFIKKHSVTGLFKELINHLTLELNSHNLNSEEQYYVCTKGKSIVLLHCDGSFIGVDTLPSDNEKLVSILGESYLHMQLQTVSNTSFAIDTDSLRAKIRNILSRLTHKDPQDIQDQCEHYAMNMFYEIYTTEIFEKSVEKIIKNEKTNY